MRITQDGLSTLPATASR